MSLGTRLVLGIGLVVAVVMGIYGASSLGQRAALVQTTLEREAEALAGVVAAVEAGSGGGDATPRLDRVLRRILQDPDVAAAALLDAEGQVITGHPGPVPSCIASLVAEAGGSSRSTWTRCPEGRRLVVISPLGGGRTLVLALGAELIERDLAAARRRILLTSLALAVFASLAILILLRLALTRPLGKIMASVRATGGPAPPASIPVPGAHEAPELRELAMAFNEMIERLEGKRETLAREVEERIELDRRLRTAETFAALGRLTGGVAHELGSPLGVIGVRAEAIQGDAGASESSRRHATEISREVERIARLVRDLIHVSRRHGPGADAVELVALLNALVEEMHSRAEESGIRVDARIPAGTVVVNGDATLLRHAIHNVMLNAMQALRDVSGERRIEVELQRAGEVARVSISDTGPGIPEEAMPHLFEPFFTTRDVGEGSGLGLAISAGIAEEHGGTLTVVPRPDGGVRAFFDLPIAAGSSEQSA